MQSILDEMELLYRGGAVGLVGSAQFDGPSDEYPDDYACVREVFHPLKEDTTLNITHDVATLHIKIVP